jgi:hypothetical protein
VTLIGPASLRPGETVQVTATAFWTDGTSRNVTNDAEWVSSDESVLSAAKGGLVTGHATGEASLRALYAGAGTGGKPFLVLPPGTVRLSGTVREADKGVFGALVEVRGQGLSTTSDWSGGYTLIGVPVDAEIRVTKERFTPAVANVQLAAGATPERRRLDLPLNPIRPPVSYSGTYTLELTATCPAASTFPAALRHRRYTALLDDDGHDVVIHLSGANFDMDTRSPAGNQFTGKVDDQVARLWLYDSWDWGIHPDVVEQLPDGNLLVVAGVVEATRTAAGLSGTLDGSIRLHGPDDLYGSAKASCHSSLHQFTLRRGL